MSSTTFDAIAATRALKAAGIAADHAEAIADQLRVAASADRDDIATKGDLRAEVAGLRADVFRALWIQAGVFLASQIAIAGFIVSMVGGPAR